MRIPLSILAALALLLGGSTVAEACHRTPAPAGVLVPLVTSDTGPSSEGLTLGGTVTCSTATVTATHPDGTDATLMVTVDGRVAETITDSGPGQTSMESVVDVPPGAFVSAVVTAGDLVLSTGPTIRVPGCGLPDVPVISAAPRTPDLTLSGRVTCSVLSIDMTHPWMRSTTLTIVDLAAPTVALDTVTDLAGTSAQSSVDVITGHVYRVTVAMRGSEEGDADSISTDVTAPKCARLRHGHR